jgi:hypothetical protein
MMRVRSARSYYQLPAFREDDDHANEAKEVTINVAAQRLNVSQWMIRRMIEEKILPARQVVVCAPWQIPVEALDSEEIRKQAMNIRNRARPHLSRAPTPSTVRVVLPMACPNRASVFASGTFSSPMRVKARYTRFARTSRSSVS